MVVGNLVRCRVQGGDTIGAFPVTGSVLAGTITAFPGPVIESAANVSDLVEIMSSSRHTGGYCARNSSFAISVQRPLPLPDDQRPASPFLTPTFSSKPYDYLLKFLLVGDSDVGKQEILGTLEEVASDTPFAAGPAHKVTTLLVDGRKIRLQLWDTSGQGRFCTILRSYSRGAQGVMLVYDITNKWSFDGIDRWLREVEEHAPGIPKVLVGNRLHLEFKRAVSVSQAVSYAKRHGMSFFEISPLCNYNVAESLAELTRRALKRNGMERLWRTNRVLSLQEMCCRTIVSNTSVYAIDRLPLPPSLRSQLRSYALSNGTSATSFRSWNRNKSSSRSADSKSSGQAKKCSTPDNNHVKMNCVIS